MLDHNIERTIKTIENALPKNTPAKLSANLKEAMTAAFKEDLVKLEDLGKNGVDLSGIGGVAAAEAYHQVLSNQLREMSAIRAMYGRETKKQREAALDADGPLRLKLWSALVAMGMPKAEFGPAQRENDIWFFRYDRTMDSTMAMEAKRGGGLSGEGLFIWGKAVLRSSGPSVDFDGLSPIRYAVGKGMDPKQWSNGIVNQLACWEGDGCKVDAMLSDLAAIGAVLSGPDPLFADIGINGRNESLIGRLMHIGASSKGIADAQKIGVDMFEISGEGESPLMALCSLNRAGRYADRAAGLLDAAEASEKGGRDKLLALRATDGSGPMHWAARALCPETLGLIASLGQIPLEKDKSGKSAGHWAAKKYGEKNQSKVGPTLKALSVAGQDWAALDKKGVSAMAALAAKGPIEVISDLLEQSPAAAKSKSGSALDALNALRSRGAHGASIADRAEIVSEMSTSEAPSKKGRARSI